MVVEKSVEYSLVFSGYYYDETYHCPIGQHLNCRDIYRLVYLRIFENIYPERCENSHQKLSPVGGATATYK